MENQALLRTGFTLIELLVTLAVAAISVTYAINGFGSIYDRHRNATFLNRLHNSFNYARSLALQSNSITTLCPLEPGSGKCTNDWHGTISIFIDSDNDREPDEGRIERVFDIPDEFHITVRPASKGYFQFTASGLSHGTLGGLLICHQTEFVDFMAYAAMNMGGRYRDQADNDHDGVIETSSGANLSCPS
ncbi:prepilin-type N-terminal cleavage/methylation domain-containing protein [Marinobacter sp. R17]|uniref:GspH/FimT family pseudopilin n=1 Tax=Marinobacter sp. R17 TaxID=2484250 RepID=UPI000F4C2F7C|nr:GspH/FimT family pseudopilin [Marinobacter sp. R17]ROU00651.1 prepilin-type N-terminal cleavage/methylation domain-containing protein [Marinobacter sp. R17]